MSKIETGGPAFPIDYETAMETESGDVSMYGTGMTMRDYFAAKALPLAFQHFRETVGRNGSITLDDDFYFYRRTSVDAEDEVTMDEIAVFSYEMADAMLKARNQP